MNQDHDDLHYELLVSRNHLYIEDTVQKKIKNTRLCFLGAGLSSSIVEYCARLGFSQFGLYDGDRVALSNLNRQAYYVEDIDAFKVDALRRRVLSINPDCEVQTQNRYIKSLDEVCETIEQYDIIINTVDCNKIYFDIINYGMSENKLVLCPYNPGYAGLVICFTRDSFPPEKVFDVTKKLDDVEIARQLFTRYPDIDTLRQANTTMNQFLSVSKSSYFPQTGIGALATSSLVMTVILKYIQGIDIPLAPEIVYVNIWNNKFYVIKPTAKVHGENANP